MAQDPSTSSSITSEEKTQQEIKNLRLTETKLQQELLDLRRPYLLRNPQLFTALIASIGAIISVSILIGDNYYKTREELNNLQAEKTAHLDQDAKRAGDAARSALLDAGEKVKAADRIKMDADSTIRESDRQVKLAEEGLKATRASLKNLDEERNSLALAAKAESLVSEGQANTAQDVATAAWSQKHTSPAQKAIVDAYALPIVVMHGHSGYVLTAGLSPNGQRVVTASEDHTARVWETSTGKQLALMDGRTAAFSPDGQRVVTASSDNTARCGSHRLESNWPEWKDTAITS